MQSRSQPHLLGLTLAASILAFWPGSWSVFEPYKQLVASLGVLALSLALFFKRREVPGGLLTGLAVAALVVLAVSAASSEYGRAALWGPSGLSLGLIWAPLPVCLCLLAAQLQPSDSRTVAAWAVAAGSVAATYAVAQSAGFDFISWSTGGDSGFEALSYRGFGTLASPTFLAMVCVCLIPLTIKLESRFGIPAAVILGAGLGASQTRMPIIALGVIALFLVRLPGSRISAFAAVAGLIASAMLLPLTGHPGLGDRLVALGHPSQGSLPVRVELLKSALAMGVSHPLGVSPGAFSAELPKHPASLTVDQFANPTSHNLILDLFGMLGWLGLALGAFAVWVCVKSFRAAPDSSSELLPWWLSLLAGALCLMAAPASLPCLLLVGAAFGIVARQCPERPAKAVWWLAPATMSLVASVFAAISVLAGLKMHGSARLAALGEPERALAILDDSPRILQIHPDFNSRRASQARLADQDAADRWFAAADSAPWRGELWAEAARVYAFEGNQIASESCWKRASFAYPYWHLPYAAMGSQAREAGRNQEAVILLERAVQINPEDADAQNNLGNAYAMTGRNALAKSAYGRAIKLRPDWELPRRNLSALISGETTP